MSISPQKKFISVCIFFIAVGAILVFFSISGISETASLRNSGKLETLTVVNTKTQREGRRGPQYTVPIVNVRGTDVAVSNSVHDETYSVGDTLKVYATTSGAPLARLPNSDNKIEGLGEEITLVMGAVLAGLGIAGIVAVLIGRKK